MNDKIEEAKTKSDEDWADEMEREEEELAAKVPSANAVDIVGPNNVQWAEEEIKKYKEEYGEDFGENIDIDF